MLSFSFKRIFEFTTIRNMKQKITLQIDQSVMNDAVSYAKNRGLNLSEVIENYLRSLSQSSNEEAISDDILRLNGILKLDEKVNYNDLIEEEMLKKYGL